MNTPLDSAAVARRLETALAAAREAGKATLAYFQRDDLAVELKADRSPVTIADREAELLVRRRIAESFPDDGIVGEEFPDQIGTSDYRWIVDPIDGTKSFVAGVPLYGTLVGVEFQDRSVIGVIHIPALNETVWAGEGSGAWHDRPGKPTAAARVSQTDSLAEAAFLTSEVGGFGATGRAEAFNRMQSATRITRTWGDCYGYLLVATGRADVMVDPQMSVWDAAALLPVMQEAGGSFTDWQGRPTIRGGEGIGANGRLLDATLATLRGS
jgi:histidinol phosphatase-like enzyme (inositol monophosphatase family)